MTVCLLAQAQSYAPRFDAVTIEDGLSQSVVNCMLQDRTGFLWFGTQEGLNRFDGYRFKVFKHEDRDPYSLSSSSINALYEDPEGVLWVGTESGLNRFDEERQRFTTWTLDPDDPHGIKGSNVNAICGDGRGGLWLTTFDGGLNRFNPETGTFTHGGNSPRAPFTLEGHSLNTLYTDPDGTLWLGTETGLYTYGPGETELVHFGDGGGQSDPLAGARIFKIFRDRQQAMWLCADQGVFRAEPESVSFERVAYKPLTEAGARKALVRQIIQDLRGYFWIGDLEGVHRFDPKTGQSVHFRHDPADPNSVGRDVISLFQDRSGVLWIGTYVDGLFKLEPNKEKFVHYRNHPFKPQSLSENGIRAMLVDRDGVLWVGTYGGGLNRLEAETETFTHFRHDPQDQGSLSSDEVLDLFQDRKGNLWVCTLSGLNRWDPVSGGFRHWRHDPDDPNTISSDLVYTLIEDKAGRFWIGTRSGVTRMNPESGMFRHYAPDADDPRSLVQKDAMCMLEDMSGDLWIGTFGGLSRYRPVLGGFINYTHQPGKPDGLSTNFISDIHQDRRGRIWVGTTAGLNRFNPEDQTFTVYGTSHGFPNEVIYCVLEDERDQLWLSTNAGLVCFDPETDKVERYDIADGLQNNEFNQGAAAKAPDGRLFFGGINGFNGFYPKDLEPNPYLPNVVITDFLVMNRPVKPTRDGLLDKAVHLADTLSLSHKDYLFSFEFSALNFANPKGNRYAYRLLGLDDDWIHTDAQNRRATYTKLAPGDYEFQVKGSNDDGLWNEAGTSVSLTISPPIYKTWWAYTLYGLLFLATVPSLYFRRINKVKRQLDQERVVNEKLKQIDRLKDDFLASTSHELRTPLNGIIGLAESLRDGVAGKLTKVADFNLAMIVSSGRRLSHLVDDLLDFSKLKNQNLKLRRRGVDLHALTQVVLTLSKPLADKKDLKLTNAVPKDLPLLHADENRLQQIMYNLLGNAIKFTERGTVTVTAKVSAPFVEIRVVDTGIGIPSEEFQTIFESFGRGNVAIDRGYPGTGLGLTVTRELVNLHGGKIWIDSTVGEGTTFAFTLPIHTDSCDSAGDTLTGTNASDNEVYPDLMAGLDQMRDGGKIEPISGAFQFRVLIVDDDSINRQVLVNHLSLHKYHVTEASSGAEALRLIETEPPFDLVLLDIMMPKMSGYEVCQKLRAKFPVHELPVIFLTAKNQITDLVTGFDVGANDYLTKPIAKNELLSRVKTHIKLLDINRNLEKKVAERTKQLNSKNEELARLNTKLEQASLTDPLTGMGNRRYLKKYLDKEVSLVMRVYKDWLAKGDPTPPPGADLIFLLLDLDHFKEVNDSYGHAAGDRVLVQIKGLLEQVARDYDILVRWGGEEFLVVIRKADRKTAPSLAARLHKIVGNHEFQIADGISVRLTCSIGFSCFPFQVKKPGRITWEQVIDFADLCMYLGKENGRNAWIGLEEGPESTGELLAANIHEHLEDMVKRGELKIMTSMPDNELTRWRAYRNPQAS